MFFYFYHFIRKSYLGGGTDIYAKYARYVYYYDVNSLYPHAMLKPMPYKIIKFYGEKDEINLDNFFGFLKVKVECPDSVTRPVLPLRVNGKTIYPKGTWFGTYLSEELKDVIKYGYKITPISGFEFSQFNPFTKYVEHFYDSKKNSTGAQRFIAKMHLNQLYGYFGRKLSLLETVIVDYEGFLDILHHFSIKAHNKIGENKFIVLKNVNLNLDLVNKLNKELQDQYLSDPIKIDHQYQPHIKSNVALASAVTSYARILMNPFKVDPNTLYTDTDSIFTIAPLPSHLIGSALGLMKDEMEGIIIQEALFLGIKQYGYWFYDKDGNRVERSTWAGVPKNTISWDDMIKLANGGKLHVPMDKYFN